MTPRRRFCAAVILGVMAVPALVADGPVAAEALRGTGVAAPAVAATLADQSAVPEAVPALPAAPAPTAVPAATAPTAVPAAAAPAAVPAAAAPTAVAGAASQAGARDTVRERESGATFPLALTPPGGTTPHWLMGTGIRQRTIFRVKVYAFGLYADAARAALSEFAGATAEALGRDRRFTRRLLDLDFGMALRLVMTRTVSGGDVAAAFDDALRPRMPRAGADDAAAALARLRGHFGVEEVRRDAEIVFSCGPAGRLAMTVDGAARPPFESRALCRALFDVYLGDDPIEPAGRRNLIAGFARLLQPLDRR